MPTTTIFETHNGEYHVRQAAPDVKDRPTIVRNVKSPYTPPDMCWAGGLWVEVDHVEVGFGHPMHDQLCLTIVEVGGARWHTSPVRTVVMDDGIRIPVGEAVARAARGGREFAGARR